MVDVEQIHKKPANINIFGHQQRFKKNPANLNRFENGQRIQYWKKTTNTQHQPNTSDARFKHHHK
jgi:hypothetical protein